MTRLTPRVVGVFAILIFLGCDDTQKKAVEAANMQNSGKVIWALEKYKQDKGVYPDDVYYVTPQYLGKLPDCIGVPKWGYKVSPDLSEYTIRVPGKQYSSSTGAWTDLPRK